MFRCFAAPVCCSEACPRAWIDEVATQRCETIVHLSPEVGGGRTREAEDISTA